jgi:hypothetical protein
MRARPRAFIRVVSVVALAAVLCVAATAHAKETRKLFDAQYQSIESDNFILQWQPALVSLDAGAARALIDDFENAYAAYHGELGYWLPQGSDVYKMNAYVSTASSTPAAPTYGGFASFADDGTPYMVISDDMIASGDPGTRLVIAHEYFHTVQFAKPAFANSASSSWWFEATANWAATKVYPDDNTFFGDIAHYVAATNQPLFLSTNTLPDDTPFFAHEYGAMIFAVYLDDLRGGPDIVKATFADAGENDDALDAIAAAVSHGATPPELFLDFAATNATWAYPASTRAKLDAWSSTYADPIALRLGANGGHAAFAGEHALHSFGYAIAAVARDKVNASHVVVALDPASGDGAGALDVSLVVDGAAHSLAVRDHAASGDVPAGASDAPALVVTTVTSPTRDPAVTYAVTVTASPVVGDRAPPVTRDVGCASTHSATVPAFFPLLALLALLAVAGRARRRGPPLMRRARPREGSGLTASTSTASTFTASTFTASTTR